MSKLFTVFFISSLLLYTFAPENYSLHYCIVIFSFYLFSSIIFLRNTKGLSYFNFHLLFLISMFFVNFVYPVFLRPINEVYFPIYQRAFNESIITKATALVYIGISSYMLGANRNKYIYKFNQVKGSDHIILYNKMNQVLIAFSYFLFIMFFITVGNDFFKGVFASYNKTAEYILVLFQPILFLTAIISVINMKKNANMNIFTYFTNTKNSLLILYILFIISFLYVGDRGPVLHLLIIIFGLYVYFIKRIKLINLILIMVLGMFIMTFISYSRTTDNEKHSVNVQSYFERGKENMKINSILDLGMDLTVTNRNLYVGMDYVDKNGINYGKTMILYPLSIIPGLQGAVVEIFRIDSKSLSTASIITNAEFKDGEGWGLGTNSIADIYMAFGIFGVIVLMYLFGFLIQLIQNKFIAHRTTELTILYIILLSLAVYIPRAEFLHPIRPVVWSYLTYILLKSFPQFKYKKRFVFET